MVTTAMPKPFPLVVRAGANRFSVRCKAGGSALTLARSPTPKGLRTLARGRPGTVECSTGLGL